MALSPGSWLNHYEILGHLGTGGMGEVYRARDNKLQREVALKVLPKVFARDPERVARFRREAQVLAQLNHPNIAAIYSVEESGGTHFLVMELALGETLRDRIKRGPVPIEEALDISKQIAAGLEAAHEKPIVHRDLKPANVKVTPEGVVKILDFGLARAFSGDTGSGDPADSPTLSAMTAPGTILGTAAYMSPEQARGKTVDKRTDIWALGCVLYELLTAKHAFDGEDVTDILASVVKSEPNWQALPEATPMKVRDLLRRCLQKDKDWRLRDAGDARIEIEETETASGTTVLAAAPAIPARTGWRRAIPLVLTAVVAIIITGLAVWNLRPVPASQPVSRMAMMLPQDQDLFFEGRHQVAFSPDGTHLVYVTSQGLYLRAMDQLEATPIRGTEEGGGRSPFFSPDGQWVGFWAGANLKKVSIGGGAPVVLCEAVNPYGASWGADDRILFGQGPAGIFQVSAAGGERELLISVDAAKGESAHGPQLLPGEEAVLFTLSSGGSWDEAQIVVEQLETGERKVLINGGTDARYVPTGHLVYAREGTLLAVPFDLGRLEVTGNAVPVNEGVTQSGSSVTGAAHFSFSQLGSLVYVPGITGEISTTLLWVDREGQEERLAMDRLYLLPRLSPDGAHVALSVRDATKDDVWIYDLARKTFPGSHSIRRMIPGPSGRRMVCGWCSHPTAMEDERICTGKRLMARARSNASRRVQTLNGPLPSRLTERSWFLVHMLVMDQQRTCMCCRWKASPPSSRFCGRSLMKKILRSHPMAAGSRMTPMSQVETKSTFGLSRMWKKENGRSPAMEEESPRGDRRGGSCFIAVAMR